tara:strand:+ start:2450 stop:3724 length:1275 start_codon:yes stop_codon:yes gene_type:complete
MAQALKFGKGVWATKTGSSMAYSDTNDRYKPLPFNVERDSIATRVNKEGLIEVVGHDKLRIDYTDTDKGVALLEPSSTNLIHHSEAFDNTYWTKSGASVTSGFTSPSGDTSAFKLVEDTSNGQHYIEVSSLSILNTTKHTLSFYVKYNGVQFIRIFSSALNSFTYFDVLNGSIGSTTAESNNIELLSNGWYRCEMTDESISTSTNFKISLAESDGVVVYIGDGTNGVEIFGAMLEANSFSTSYIPTSGSSVQRAADVANGSGNSEVFSDSQGVLFADIKGLVNGSTDRWIGINNGSTSNRIIIALTGVNNKLRFYSQGSTTLSYNDINILDHTMDNKIALVYSDSQDSVKIYANGFLSYNQTSIPNFSGFKQLNFDNGGGAGSFHGKTKEIGYYDAVLTDSELEYLTSYRSLSELVKELNLNTL